MSFKIGFTAKPNNESNKATVPVTLQDSVKARKSVVQIYFPTRHLTCSYYNDTFDLHCGDIVYVDGKLEGLRGRVVDVSYTFKIKLSDYKRVIAKADTNVKGNLYMAKSHFVAFEPSVIPFEKVISWFKAPQKPEDEYVFASDNETFLLENLNDMKVSAKVAERGAEYFFENNVVYISIDGIHGRAIVEGSQPYEVEFKYQNGEISDLVCSCFCSYTCKHEFAAMLQLRDILKSIEENYSEQYRQSNYFAAVAKISLFDFAVDNKEAGSFTL